MIYGQKLKILEKFTWTGGLMENALRWFEIYVADMARARSFYQKVFAFHFTKMEASSELEMWSFSAPPKTDGFGALVWMKGLSPSGVSTIVYFGSEDCSVEERRVIGAGGRIHKSKFSIGQYGFISLVHDSEGNMIGIHSTK